MRMFGLCNSNGQDQNANYHGLGELLKQLPEAMQDPVAVIRSETRRGNSVVVLADLKDQSGNSVVVPVRVDGYGRLNGVEIDANAAASAYGKKNAVAGLLKNALAAEAQGEVGVYYINKNKAKSPSLAAGVQFPGGVHGLDGFIHSIHEQKADVNTSLPDVTGSKQFKRWFGDWQKSPMSASKIVDAEGMAQRKSALGIPQQFPMQRREPMRKRGRKGKKQGRKIRLKWQ